MLAAQQAGTFVPPSRMPLRDFVEPWVAALENQGRKPTTLRGYRTTLDAYVPPRLGDVALQELRASDLDALYAELLRSGGRRGQGLSMTTVHHVHAVVNKVLHDAERKGLVIRNVAKLANAPSLTTRGRKVPRCGYGRPTSCRGSPMSHGRPARCSLIGASLDKPDHAARIRKRLAEIDAVRASKRRAPPLGELRARRPLLQPAAGESVVRSFVGSLDPA